MVSCYTHLSCIARGYVPVAQSVHSTLPSIHVALPLQISCPPLGATHTDSPLCQLIVILIRPSHLLQGSKSFFSEIISSVADMKWSSDGRYILARDYMNLKLWDLNMESAPVATYSVHEHLRAKASSTA